ncbi:MAG: FKBP-type peptidyl-prolyl cis-trans isomerase [Mogibacterium sp.]|nr:FKBP-type peptidyl-prolyl cis-trans isomerase [Mogibacterium sp.]
MRIAVTYENGLVFQHFGHTEYFKVYTVEDGKVVSAEVVGSDGTGHGALAGLLADHAIDVLICGGLGGGAMTALQNAGIEVVAGAEGDADQVVEAYLRGELVSTGANCDHHDHAEGEACGEHGCGDSEGGCGGCSGCGPQIMIEGPNAGKTVRVHYRGTFDDGTQFDSSYDRGEPLEFICGAGMMIPGFDIAVAEMALGQVVDVRLEPEEAYGPYNPEAVFTIDVSQMPGSEELNAGDQVYLQNAMGQPFPAKVTAREGSSITFDLNHEMAGKALNFRIELIELA